MDLGREKVVRQIISRLKTQNAGGAVLVEGTWGSFAPLLIKYASEQINRPILYITPHIDDTDKSVEFWASCTELCAANATIYGVCVS